MYQYARFDPDVKTLLLDAYNLYFLHYLQKDSLKQSRESLLTLTILISDAIYHFTVFFYSFKIFVKITGETNIDRVCSHTLRILKTEIN